MPKKSNGLPALLNIGRDRACFKKREDSAQTLAQGSNVQPVIDLCSALLAFENAGIFEHFQMVRNSRTAQMKMLSNLPHIEPLMFAQQKNDFQPHRLTQTREQADHIFFVKLHTNET